MNIKTLVPWYGSNRMNAERVGELLKGCEWVGVPFAGGMCEVPYITARTIAVNDLHHGVISLAKIVAVVNDCVALQAGLKEELFHPDTLMGAQRVYAHDIADCEFDLAQSYFIVAWMTRSGTAGTPAEANGKLALRWEAGGGDSVKRYHSAIDSLPEWCEHFQRCQFTTLDVFDFLDKCKDREKHGIYCDPPFLGASGARYTHNLGKDGDNQEAFHISLAARLDQYKKTRVVVRAYEDPFIRALYPAIDWAWHSFDGRKQNNHTALEVLIVRN